MPSGVSRWSSWIQAAPVWLSAPGVAIRAVARNGGLRSLLLASALQTTCRWVLVVTLLLVAYQTGGVIAVGVVGLVRTLSALATIPVSSLLGGRRREHVLGVLVAVRATVVIAAAATLAFEMPGILFIATGIDAFAGTLRRPVHAALMPSLARTPEELVAANVATNFSENAGSLVGPILGGLLLATFGPVWALLVAGLGLALAAGLVAIVRDVHPGMGPGSEAGRPIASGGVPAVAAGARMVISTPGVRVVAGLVLADALVRGALAAVIVVLAVQRFGDDGATVGFLSAMPGLGGLIGVACAFGLLSIGRLGDPLVAGLIVAGLAAALLASTSGFAATAAVLAAAGTASAVVRIASTTILQRAIRREDRTGAIGALEGMAEGAMGIGAIGASLMIDGLGTVLSIIAIGIVVVLVGAAIWQPIRRFERTLPARGRAFEVLVPFKIRRLGMGRA